MGSSTARTGAAGVFYAAAVLAEHGWDASLTIGNTPRTDVVAQHHEHQTLIAVQCKATIGNKFSVGIHGESPSPAGRNEWFIFVALSAVNARPEFFVVPRNVVAAYVYVGHRAGLTVPGKGGEPRETHAYRGVEKRAVKYYRERWDLLEQPIETVPYWLPDLVFEWAPHTGLPEGHPGLVKPDDGVVSPEDRAWAPPWWPQCPVSRR